VPILIFLGLSVLDLVRCTRQTDVRQHHRLMPPPGAGHKNLHTFLLLPGTLALLSACQTLLLHPLFAHSYKILGPPLQTTEASQIFIAERNDVCLVIRKQSHIPYVLHAGISATHQQQSIRMHHRLAAD